MSIINSITDFIGLTNKSDIKNIFDLLQTLTNQIHDLQDDMVSKDLRIKNLENKIKELTIKDKNQQTLTNQIHDLQNDMVTEINMLNRKVVKYLSRMANW